MHTTNNGDPYLLKRIDELEGRYKRLSRVIPLLLLFSTLPYLLGQSSPREKMMPQPHYSAPTAIPQNITIRLPEHASFRSVTAGQYLMTDSQGRKRGGIFVNPEGQSQLSLFDGSEKEVISITNSVRCYGDKNRSVVDCFGLGLYSNDGTKRCILAAVDRAEPGLQFYDASGNYVGKLLIGNGPALQVIAKDGTVTHAELTSPTPIK
jgi:hypothetical protein